MRLAFGPLAVGGGSDKRAGRREGLFGAKSYHVTGSSQWVYHRRLVAS